MTLGDFIDRLLKALHLRKSDLQKWRDKLAETDQKVRSNNDRLQDIRDELVKIDQQKKVAQQKADGTSGMIRQTYLAELQQFANDEQRFNEQLAIVFRNHKLGQDAVAKIRSIILALESPVKTDDIDSIIFDVDQIFQSMRDGDAALNELNSLSYAGTGAWQVETNPQPQGQQGALGTTPETVQTAQPVQPVQTAQPVEPVQQAPLQAPVANTVDEALNDLDQGVRSIAMELAGLDENN